MDLSSRLGGRVALVTGGATGIGLGIARRLAAEGARVAISDINSETGRQVAAENGFTFFEHDVRDAVVWKAIIGSMIEAHGRFDILVNNAGFLGSRSTASFENTQLEDLRSIFAINFEGTLLGCQAAIPEMGVAGNGGSIINMSSVAGLTATPHFVAYGAAKAAVRQLTKSVAQHCASKGFAIRCNSIHPGIVRTAMWNTQAAEAAQLQGIATEDYVQKMSRLVPLRAFTQIEEIAAAAAFLASDDSKTITGSKTVIDGGMTECESYYWIH